MHLSSNYIHLMSSCYMKLQGGRSWPVESSLNITILKAYTQVQSDYTSARVSCPDYPCPRDYVF